jgi:hypothetical protein
MTDESAPEASQPIFHGSPSGTLPPAARDKSLDTKFAAGVAFGVGSAALVAALLYARRTKTKIASKPRLVEPSD